MSASSADSLADQLSQLEPGAAARPDEEQGDAADDLAALLDATATDREATTAESGDVAQDGASTDAPAVAVDDDGDAIVVADDDAPAEQAASFDAVDALRAVTHGDASVAEDAIHALGDIAEGDAEGGAVDDAAASQFAEATSGPAWIAPVAAGVGGAAAGRSPRGKPATRTKEADGMKGVMAPILLALGAVMLIPALWSAGQLLGLEVWSHDEPKARVMAYAMLICWPLAGVIIFAAIMMIRQVLRRRKKAKA